MADRREAAEERAEAALRAAEAAWRARLARLEPGPGDEYFADFPPDAELEEGQRVAVREIRALLAQQRPKYVRPEDTTGSFDDHYMLELVISHRTEPVVQIRLTYGDGYLSLRWPDGAEHDKWEWSPLLARAVDGLLAGRNIQTFHERLGRVFAIDTEIWDEVGARYRLRRRWNLRAGLLALLPLLPTSQRRRSISFHRSPAMVEK